MPDPYDEKKYKNLYPLIERYKNDYVIAALIGCTLFEGAWYLRGLENWLIDLIENSDFANDILDKLTDFYIKAGKRLIEIGVDIIITGDDFGMQD
jgi:uroporphyrinogen decarboxylase